MSFADGTRLGAYEITGQIGAGGMGVVYRATDSKLGRDVAIKTLPAGLAEDKDRLARFEREAKLLAALHHPHIASVFSLDEHEGTLYLAMELVEGETLEEKLKPGALSVEDALRLALQIAEALEAAHGKGVVHRDLKPANVMVTHDGIVKVLDFGLAKAFSDDPNQSGPEHSPALSLAMTQQGLVLGTAGYMSPEQASGQATDQRADIWAFGVVVYEMLTGLPLFSGESVPHILADVLKTEPDWSRLPNGLHSRVRLLLERCLEKRVRNRYHSIADARVDIEKALTEPDSDATVGASDSARSARSTPSAAWIAAGIVLALGSAAGGWVLKSESLPPAHYWSFVLDETQRLRGAESIAVSREASAIAVATREGIRLRQRDSFDDRLIYEGAAWWPVFAPDGESIVFYDRMTDQLKSVQVRDSRVTTLCTCDEHWGVTWSTDREWLYFGTNPAGIVRIRATGGEPTVVVPGPALYPQVLPDGEDSIMFSASVPNGDGPISVFSQQSGETTALYPGFWSKYVASGHVIGRIRDTDTLYARTLDLGSLEFGDAVEVARDVPVDDIQFAIDESGVLAFVAEGVGSSDSLALVIYPRDGGASDVLGAEPRSYVAPRISPDGTQIAVHATEGENSNSIYLIDVSGSGRADIRWTISDEGDNGWPVWSPDNQWLAFYSTRNGEPGVYRQRVDRSEPAERLTSAEEGTRHLPSSWSVDGLLAYSIIAAASASVKILDLESDETTDLTVSGSASRAVFSADGKLIAYQNAPPNGDGVLVSIERYPRTSERIELPIPTRKPVWAANGTELFYVTEIDGDSVLQNITVESTAGLTYRLGETLDPPGINGGGANRNYDPLPDGSGWLLVGSDQGAADESARLVINVISNWGEELKRLVPTD